MRHRGRRGRQNKRPRRKRKSSRKPKRIKRLSRYPQDVAHNVHVPPAASSRRRRPGRPATRTKATRRKRVHRSFHQAPVRRHPRQRRRRKRRSDRVHSPQSVTRLIHPKADGPNIWPQGVTRHQATQPRGSRNQNYLKTTSTTNYVHPQAATNYLRSLHPGNFLPPQAATNYTNPWDNVAHEAASVLSRSPRGSSHPHAHRHPRHPNTFHPQSRDFIHPQSKVNFHSRRTTARNSQEIVGSRPDHDHPSNTISRDDDTPPGPPSSRLKHSPVQLARPSGRGRTHPERDESLVRECSKTFTWKKAAGRRYGDVVVALRNRRKLDLLLGDVDANLLVTRTKNRHGQHFLGFYLENHRVLSPNTTGIIGQFAYKTVGTIAPGRSSAHGTRAKQVRLAVVQQGPTRRYEVSEVNAFLSSRRSLLHKTHVTCLFIRQQGRGLVAGSPDHYLLPCLAC